MDIKSFALLLKLTYGIIVTIAFLVSLVSFRWNYPRHLKLFSILLGITCIVEWLATQVVRKYWHWHSNVNLYNVFMLIEFMAYAYYYYFIIRIVRIRNAIKFFMIAFPLFWLITVVFIFGLNTWNSYVVIVGAVLAVTMSLAYFYQLLRQTTDIHLLSHPEFWIAAGMFTLYLGQIPYFGMFNYVLSRYPHTSGYISLVMLFLNILMYLSFTYAFLCPKLIPMKR